MSRETTPLSRVKQYINTHKKQTIFGLVLPGFVLFYSVAFFIPKQVQFSYAGPTCVGQLTIFPDLHKISDDKQYAVDFQEKVNIGSFAIASTRTCFAAVSEPQPGNTTVATSPFGGLVARKNFSINVPSLPTAHLAAFDKPLPVSKPLEIALSQPDAVFEYKLANRDKTIDCNKSQRGVNCDVPALDLEQGKQYTLKLTRQFKDSAAKTLAEKPVHTLKAVNIKKASLKNKQVVYAKPTSFSFTMDKALTKGEVELTTLGKKPQTIDVSSGVKGKILTIKLAKQLPREAKYRLMIKTAEATDGSTLVEPVKIDFTMSGGPKVVGVNIDRTNVATSATVAITFDQEVAADAKKYISMKGGGASISQDGKTIYVALQDLPLCKVFSLGVATGMPSKYGIKSKSSWNYASRTICYRMVTYGTSLEGRALNAYIFGSSGPVTMYVGAIHGNEPSSSGLMQAWVSELQAHPERLDGKRIVVVPTINPDGVAANTRTNSRGVNLNRNFPTDNWERDIDDTDGTHKNGGGKTPLSEPEAKALASLTQQYHPRLLLSFHAIGSLVQGDTGSPSASYAAKYASLVGYSNATGQADTFDYSITGGYEEWAWRKLGAPSMVIELGSYTAYYIDHHREALWAML